ncbi:hypothetical protein Shyd_57980 [Streptomyces hydrogenans]|uniref:Uncharacterized protein n=1 Tax=Streptomyces hydrogenans TaxID=1873719 RepID=A0ABQ3PHC4_9ACTN|nr:hypothetical protein Shyd_57980 [Streptomyces hydrogenans]
MDREELRMSKVALAAAQADSAGGRRALCLRRAVVPRASARGARPVLLTLVRPGLGTLCLIRGGRSGRTRWSNRSGW